MRDHHGDFRSAVMAATGASPDHIEPGRLHRFSTNGKAADTSGWCQLFKEGTAGVMGDFRTDLSTKWLAQQANPITPAQHAEQRRAAAQARVEREGRQKTAWSDAAGRLDKLWGQSEPVCPDGTDTDPMTRYLRNRLMLADGQRLHVPPVLRVHRDLAYFHDDRLVGRWPAMIGMLQGPGGEPVALHRTWLTSEGGKAPVPGPAKKLTAACGPVIGACIRLAWLDPDKAAAGRASAGTLGVAEGIETALAASCGSGVPVVAAYSAGALAGWHWPRELRRLVVFGDADAAGVDAADKLSHRARAAGLAVFVSIPSSPCADWCDVWAGRETGVCAGVAA